jgi:sulfonate transport system substrate-binding protein
LSPRNNNSSPEKRPLVVAGVPEHFNLPWHLAIESGAFTKRGIELEYRDVPGGTGAMTRGLRESEIDIAIVLAEGGVADLLKGNPSRIVKSYVESPLIWGIHVAADSPIETIDQIQGQTYAISRFGSGSHLMAIVDASERDWPIAEMKFDRIGNLEGARKALATGDADTFFWERFTTSPYVQNGEFRRVGERLTLWPAFIICVREDVLSERSADVKTVLDIVNQSCAELMADENACKLISDRYQIQLDDVEEWFSKTQWSIDFEHPSEAIENIKAYLLKVDIITAEQANSKELWFHFED